MCYVELASVRLDMRYTHWFFDDVVIIWNLFCGYGLMESER